MVIKQLNIKNRTYYFYNDLIDLDGFDADLLKLDKKGVMNINDYYIGYVTKRAAYNIDSVNPLYLNIYTLDGFIEEKDGSKYLNITLTDYNNNFLKKYSEVWKEIKNQIVKINNGLGGEYHKDYMKIQFDSDDDLLLNKVMKFYDLTVIINTNLVDLEKILVFPDGAVSYDIYSTHIVFNNVDIYFECVNEEKYLVFALIDKNFYPRIYLHSCYLNCFNDQDGYVCINARI